MTTEAVTIKISGIKCDNTECDYSNEDVNRDNYLEYVDKSCPDCGSILLTQADYDTVKTLEDIAYRINVDVPEGNLLDDEESRFSIEMDGSGDLKLNELKTDEKVSNGGEL